MSIRNKVKGCVKQFSRYFIDVCLDNYSICERHYNQIVANNSFLEKLKENDNTSSSSSDENQQKKLY